MIILHLICSLFIGTSSFSGTGSVIDGYMNRTSAFPGDSVELYLHAPKDIPAQSIRLFDLKGNEVARFSMRVFPQEINQAKAYEHGYGYKLTRRIATPDLKSGVYLWENKIPFIIKARSPRVVILYPSNTENAYNNNGGKSLYGFNSSNKEGATVVSFLRPSSLPRHAEAFLRWMVTQNFDNVGYISDMDMDDYNAIRKSAMIIVPGHSEYWTVGARRNFDRFVKEGKDALVLSGNTMWWQVRYNEKRNQLICYRKAELDPVKDKKLKTINWNDVSLRYPILPSIGTEFPRAGYGRKEDKGWDGYKIIAKSPLLEKTNLLQNDILYFASDEVDGAPLQGFLNGIPRLDYSVLGFSRVEIVGYDLVSRGGAEGVATWIVCKPSHTSGIIINTASTDWCSYSGIGASVQIQTITHTMISKLLNKENVFSPEPAVVSASESL